MMTFILLTLFVCSFIMDKTKSLLSNNVKDIPIQREKKSKKDSLLNFDIFCDIIDEENDND